MSKIKIIILFIVVASCSVLFGTNNALNFNGYSSVDCGTSVPLQLLGNFTMEAWIKPVSSYSINSIMGNRTASLYGSGVAFHVNGYTTSNRSLMIEYSGGSAGTASYAISLGVWQHVAVTYDGTDVKFYINGNQVPTMSNGYNSTTPDYPFKIGAMGGDYYGFNGTIDDVRVWSIARDAASIAANYNKELYGNENGLIAYYKLDEGTGTSVADASANNLNANFGYGTPVWVESEVVIEGIQPAVYPSLATLVGPITNTEFLAPISTQLEWSYAGEDIDGFELSFDGGEVVILDSDVFSYSPDNLAYNTEYEWTVTPYIAPNTKPEDVIETWSFTTTNLYVEETPALIQGTPISVQLSAVLTGFIPTGWTPNGPSALAEPTTENPLLSPLPTNHGSYTFGASISQSVAGSFTYTFIVPGGNYTGDAYLDGELYFTGTWVGGVVIVDIPFTGAKDTHEVVITDTSLPITLSSFTAIQTSNNLAKISWETASESNILGYNLYRAETDNQDEALRLTATMIEGTNSPSGASYSYVDAEVEFDVLYNYWLQSNDFDGTSEMHGPVTVKISTQEDNDIEEMLLGTQMFANYPNPFNPSTTISFSVAEAQVVTIDVFNVKGQLVKRLFNSNVAELNVKHSVVWNGQDSDGQKVASGIYFTTMKAGNKSFSNKTILMK